MELTAAQLFKELEQAVRRPIYHIVGTEIFQRDEVLSRLHSKLVKQEAFQLESFDGESLVLGDLVNSLQMMPSLFGDECRVVQCRHFDKLKTSAIDELLPYFKDPNPSTSFILISDKVDKRRAWVKIVDEKGAVIAVSEPKQPDWPRWKIYFEKRLGKTIDPMAWDWLLTTSSHTLSIVWCELQKVSLYAEGKTALSYGDVVELTSGHPTDLFGFIEAVFGGRKLEASKKYENLSKDGESDLKLLTLLTRQFRMAEQALQLSNKGISDNARLATQLGVPPFVAGKILQSARRYSIHQLHEVIGWLSDCDYKLKRGQSALIWLPSVSA